MSDIRTIGILTSGGDAPGMNRAIRAATRTAIYYGYAVKGIRHGFSGLLEEDIIDLNLRSVSEIIHRGGTMLYTARSKEFMTLEGQMRGAEICRKHGIDALIVVGGDGSFMGCQAISRQGVHCIGIPGTIDNDIACSDYTIGYDTALNTAMEMIDKLRDTTQSHERCCVVEVMGRHAGYIAINTAIATGALSVLIPEKENDIQRDVIDRIVATQKEGKKNFMVIVAEGAGQAFWVAEEINRQTGIEARATVLGHVQRGGSPTTRDRVLAAKMAVRAVELINDGSLDRVIGIKQGDVVDFDIDEALKMQKTIDKHTMKVAEIISI